MEKKRRARINRCLNELKNLLLQSLKRDPAQTSKLEKADILEMSVHLLRSMQRQQLAMAASSDCSVLDKFQSGWAECAMQVAQYSHSIDGFDQQLRMRLLRHLDQCYRNIHATKHGFAAAAAAKQQLPMRATADLASITPTAAFQSDRSAFTFTEAQQQQLYSNVMLQWNNRLKGIAVPLIDTNTAASAERNTAKQLQKQKAADSDCKLSKLVAQKEATRTLTSAEIESDKPAAFSSNANLWRPW